MSRSKPDLEAFVRVLGLQKPAILPLNLRQQIGFVGKRKVPLRRLDVQDAAGVREVLHGFVNASISWAAFTTSPRAGNRVSPRFASSASR